MLTAATTTLCKFRAMVVYFLRGLTAKAGVLQVRYARVSGRGVWIKSGLVWIIKSVGIFLCGGIAKEFVQCHLLRTSENGMYIVKPILQNEHVK